MNSPAGPHHSGHPIRKGLHTHDHDCSHDHDNDHRHDCGHDHDHDCSHDHDHRGSLSEDAVRFGTTQVPFTEGKLSTYRQHGIGFRYPSHWTLTEESGPQETMIHLESPGTSFWSLTLFEELVDPERIMETVVSAYEDDYSDLDIYMGATVADGLPTVSREIDFTCSNRLVSASLVAFQSRERTILIIFQGDDIDLVHDRPQLEAISQSLTDDGE